MSQPERFVLPPLLDVDGNPIDERTVVAVGTFGGDFRPPVHRGDLYPPDHEMVTTAPGMFRPFLPVGAVLATTPTRKGKS